jgi:hypothetical protein
MFQKLKNGKNTEGVIFDGAKLVFNKIKQAD